MKFELLENEILGDAALVGQPTIYRDAPVRVKCGGRQCAKAGIDCPVIMQKINSGSNEIAMQEAQEVEF